MPRIRWTAPARADLRSIDTWPSKKAGPDFTLRTLTSIRFRARFLDFPQGGRPTSHGFRVSRVLDTPYRLLYRLKEGEVEILRVRHEREDWLILP